MNFKNSFDLVITGAAGFIGARLAHIYHQQGLKILAVDDENYYSSRRCTKSFRDSIPCVSPKEFINLLKSSAAPNFASLIHMGACSRTDEMRSDYLAEVNTNYSKILWDYCSSQKISFFYASSASTYGAGEWGYDDAPELLNRLKPLNPYGQSKQAFDLWVMEKTKDQLTPPHWAGFKFFNVYGPFEDHKNTQASVLMHAFDQFQKQKFIRLFKSHKNDVPDGEQKRDFIYVDDVFSCIDYFRTHQAPSGIYNLGTGQARSFLDLAHACAAAMKIECQMEWIDTPKHLQEHYQYFTEATTERLRAAGYNKPFYSLEEGAKMYFSERV